MQQPVMVQQIANELQTSAYSSSPSLANRTRHSSHPQPVRASPAPAPAPIPSHKLISKHELPRKIFHSSIGFITIYLYSLGSIEYSHVKYPLIFAFLVLFPLDLIRLNSPTINTLYCKAVGFLMRQSEVNHYNGVLWYLLGLTFSFTFFERDIALISVCLLSWADTAASSIGRKFGHLTPKLIGNKSLAGSSAAFLVGYITCLTFYGVIIPKYDPINKPGKLMWLPHENKLSLNNLSLCGGFIASLSEAIDLFGWDDNFTIPVFSSIFFYIIITVFQV
ncbi:hypothetical protein TBLA_0D00720 [Henningerozyma blattae CBS 6284]|uniref:Uncharacterized protein n=1 Tax=Henningerozyma blattae (strain ATCC 34711 / CBS 6284 / DSM 70876 / NBRC 10599 / NRRL Y-10934 / UCD 77-7) TaxID=1071380 RepID=I2H2H8_HENB6|nr:hypothetical protein TBLA_0D00720 [Tetrapisispora blattae CBS 6284]CCH60580.1 hypothetical protein TBLA_0D00720 [Tetrapisispora blattae CBS 6284]